MRPREPAVGFALVCQRSYPYRKAEKLAEKAIENLRNSGLKVTYSGQAILNIDEAEKAADHLRREHIDMLIMMPGTWVEGDTAMTTIERFRDIPVLLWSFPRTIGGGSLPAAGYLRATLEEMEIKFKFAFGAVDDEKTIERISKYAKVCLTASLLRRSRIGLIGYASMGMYTATSDHVGLRSQIGPEVVHIDNYTFIDKMSRISDGRIKEGATSIDSRYSIDPSVDEKELLEASRMYLAFQELVEEFELDALTAKCQYELSHGYGRVPCASLSILADENLVCSCEGDINLTVTMLMLFYLTGNPICYGDVIDMRNNRLTLSSCGFAPLSLASDRSMGIRMYSSPRHSVGLRSSITLRSGRVTLARLGGRKGAYKMHIATGRAIDTKLRDGWAPAAEVMLDGNPERFIQSLLSQHYAIVWADLKDELVDLCNTLHVNVVDGGV